MKTTYSKHIADVPNELWQTFDSPFTRCAYWQALEDCGLIGAKNGAVTDWESRYVVVYKDGDASGSAELAPVAMLPVFIKHHHAGEYVFDHAWAQAFHRYGIDYYPRLVTSVPFTPVAGQRIWLVQGEALTAELARTLTAGLDALAAELTAPTWHGLFIDPAQKQGWDNATSTLATPMLERQGCQFLWHNRNTAGKPLTSFDEFLAKLTAKKRKNIRAERRKVAEAGISCLWKLGEPKNIDKISQSQPSELSVSPDPITDADWQTFYHCYAMTYAVRGQRPYLTLKFFKQLARTMPENLALAQALDSAGKVVACSLFFYDARAEVSTLYGRYWGALQEVSCLHFELCYYQGISFAIALGLTRFDPGTQGEHKLIRGFEPTMTHSLHRVYVPEFVPAIREFCRLEMADVADYAAVARGALPFKQQ